MKVVELTPPLPQRILQAQDVHKLSRIGGVGGVKKFPLNRVKVLLVYSRMRILLRGFSHKNVGFITDRRSIRSKYGVSTE